MWKFLRRMFLLLALVIPLPQAWADKPTAPPSINGVANLSAEAAIELILTEPTLLIIDSRKQEEYAKGHIEGAVSLLDTHMNPEILKQHTGSKNTPILFYCNGPRCLRSANAIIKAQQWGYHNLYWFRGGWAEWRDKKLPITK